MTTTEKAWGATSATDPLSQLQIERRDTDSHDVRIKIEYAGICHSDLHTVRSEWGEATFPLVPGHEIVGTVTEVGPEVTKWRVGQRVGVGVFVDSCRECENCRAGEEQYCLNGMTGTYGVKDRYGQITQGGYSTGIVVHEDYVLNIPEGLKSEEAAPLLCAGITVYSPLAHWQAGPGKQVAVVGMGGLGHMAVKIAAAMGATVTVLSQTTRKAEDAVRFGATEALATSEPETFRNNRGRFDLIINTVSADLDLQQYLSLLRTEGTLVQVGMPPEPMAVNAKWLAGGRKSLSGSMIGGVAECQQMLDFCAEKGFGAQVEVIEADQVNEAYERMLASDVRYRFVIDASSI